jgi:hypothetical protein
MEVDEGLQWGSDLKCQVKGRGTIQGTCIVGNEEMDFTMHDAIYVPAFKMKLFSVGAASNHGWKFFAGRKQMTVTADNDVMMIARKVEHNFYGIRLKTGKEINNNIMHEDKEKNEENDNKVLITKEIEKTEKMSWHKKFGHLSFDNLRLLKTKTMVRGLENAKVENKQNDPICDDCMVMKATRTNYKGKSGRTSKRILEIIHSDICGPISPSSIGGAKYFLTFTDDYSRKTEIFLLKEKSEVMSRFVEFKNRSERETGKLINILRTDNGGEFTGKKFEEFLKNAGIKHELTMSYTPEQNGVSERMNRTLLEKTRCMLRSAGLEEKFWGEAILTANFLKNRSPSRIIGNQVPDEIWRERKPTVKYFHIFGSKAYVLNPKERRRGKLAERAKCMIFMGYASNRRGFRFWNPEERKIVFSKDVKFIDEQRIETSKPEMKKSIISSTESENNVEEEEIEIQIFEDRKPEQGEIMITDSDTEEISNDSSEEEEESEEEDNDGDPNDEENEVIIERNDENDDRRILRERTPQVKPTKYSAFAWDDEEEDTSGNLMSLYGPYPGATYI